MNEQVFKIGDLVERIESNHHGHKIGDQAIITYIQGVNIRFNDEYNYNAECYKLINEAQPIEILTDNNYHNILDKLLAKIENL